MMLPALNAGLSGMQMNQSRLDVAAARIADPAHLSASDPATTRQPAQDLAQPLVDSMIARNGFSASAAVVRRADSLIGSLIDTRA
jgi:flagellar hook protein FlgE